MRQRATIKEKTHFTQQRFFKAACIIWVWITEYFGYLLYTAHKIKLFNSVMTSFNNLTGKTLTNEGRRIKTDFCYKFKNCMTLWYCCILLLSFKKDKLKIINFTSQFLELEYMHYVSYFYLYVADRKCWAIDSENRKLACWW